MFWDGTGSTRVLEEQRITRETVFDQETALRLGRLMGSETVLVGDIAGLEGIG